LCNENAVMKKMMTVLSLFAALNGWAQVKEEHSMQDLVGMWRNGSGAGLDIVDSNTVYIVRGDQRKLALASVRDIQKNPVDFNLMVKDSSRIVTLKGLLLIVNDDMLQWQVFDSETKPASFSNNRSDMLFLKRIDKLIN
jgi:hypothetical protein